MTQVLAYLVELVLRSSALEARPDVGHLWYLSVYLQAMVFLTFLVFSPEAKAGRPRRVPDPADHRLVGVDAIWPARSRRSPPSSGPASGSTLPWPVPWPRPACPSSDVSSRTHVGCEPRHARAAPAPLRDHPHVLPRGLRQLTTVALLLRARGRTRSRPARANRDPRSLPPRLPRPPLAGPLHLALPRVLFVPRHALDWHCPDDPAPAVRLAGRPGLPLGRGVHALRRGRRSRVVPHPRPGALGRRAAGGRGDLSVGESSPSTAWSSWPAGPWARCCACGTSSSTPASCSAGSTTSSPRNPSRAPTGPGCIPCPPSGDGCRSRA